MKLSGGKASYPGRKQVWRHYEGDRAVADTIALGHETGPAGARPLLDLVVRDGRLVGPLPSLDASRRWHAGQVEALPVALYGLDAPAVYPVRHSGALDALTAATAEGIASQTSG
jgi:nicotinate phosphoribosyltransferase